MYSRFCNKMQPLPTTTVLSSPHVQVHVFTSVAGPDKLFGVDVTRGAGMGGNYPGASLSHA